MDPITTSIVTGIASGMLANFSTDAVKHFFFEAIKAKPELEARLKSASHPAEIETIFRDAVGVIDASAAHGEIKIDGSLLRALRGIRFDHAHGTVTIAGTTVNSHVLVTGGSSGATGRTVIGGNTSMNSHGTSMEVGNNCSIVITGGASIRQT
jgi:hypothetical protein